MKLSHVPVNMFRKFFIILLCVFVGLFVLEFVASMMGNPISQIMVDGEEMLPETLPACLFHAAITSLIFSGIVNFFLTINILKEALGLSHWPAALVVFMTMLFALEVLLGAVFVVPNIVIFGLKGRMKNRMYKVEF